MKSGSESLADIRPLVGVRKIEIGNSSAAAIFKGLRTIDLEQGRRLHVLAELLIHKSLPPRQKMRMQHLGKVLTLAVVERPRISETIQSYEDELYILNERGMEVCIKDGSLQAVCESPTAHGAIVTRGIWVKIDTLGHIDPPLAQHSTDFGCCGAVTVHGGSGCAFLSTHINDHDQGVLVRANWSEAFGVKHAVPVNQVFDEPPHLVAN